MTSDSQVELRGLMKPLNGENNSDNDDDDTESSDYCHRQCLKSDKYPERKPDELSERYLQNDVDETNIQEQLFSTLNQIEDNLDEHTYKEIIPLHLRIQLENQVFGWTHLSSIFFGHLFYTLSAYFLTFWVISYVSLKRMQIIQFNDDQIDSHSSKGCGWHCFIDKVYYNGRGSTDSDTYYYIPIMGLPPLAFVFIRIICSISSAFSAFRTVRRRTMVWLDSPSKREREISLKETDRTTLLGRIRSGLAKRKNNWISGRTEKRITRASRRFEARHQRRKRRKRKMSNSVAQYEGEHHAKVLQLGSGESNRAKPRLTRFGSKNRITIESTSTGGEDSTSSSSRNRHKNIRKRPLKKTVSESVLDPCDFLETFQKYEGHDKNSTYFCGHTMPASAMQSVLQDQIRFKQGLVQNVPYAHGGYFGAAPFMLANPHWINILRCLMPDVYVEISHRAMHAPIPQLIHWAENNPVMAAYGTAHDLEYRGIVPTLEIDVFLDPHLVQRIEIVLDARNEILDDLQNGSKKSVAGNKRFSERMDAVEKLLTPHERSILGFFNTEIKKRVNTLVKNMLIAHGNALQLILEQTGYLKQYNFSRVRHMRRTLGGGIFAEKWITIYAEALRMSTKLGNTFHSSDHDNFSETSSHSRGAMRSFPKKATVNTMSNGSLFHKTEVRDLDDHNLTDESIEPKNSTGTPRGGVSPLIADATLDEQVSKRKSSKTRSHTSSNPSTPITEAITMLKRIMNCEAPLGLFIDIKSRHVPKRIWALIVDSLREAGIRVEGIGSFCVQEIRDISQLCSAPVRDFVFFHTAGDLQKACHDGSIKRGDSVFFNGGSLFYNLEKVDIGHLLKMAKTTFCKSFDVKSTTRGYRFESHARVARRQVSDGELVGIPESTVQSTEDSSDETYVSESSGEKNLLIPRRRSRGDVMRFKEGYGSTIEQYKDAFELSIGLYVQEFAIDDKSIDLIVKYVNENPRIYNLGLGWGGINGVTVRGIQPGRFTTTDGLWNQRYVGQRWDTDLFPPSCNE